MYAESMVKYKGTAYNKHGLFCVKAGGIAQKGRSS